MFSYLKGFFQARNGQKFGNQVADYLKINRSLFHSAMEEGGCEMHLIKLHYLRSEGTSIDKVADHACDFLFPGLMAIESRFGKQALINEAKEAVINFKGIQ